MDRHEATTAFVGAGVAPTEAEALGQAVELLSSVPSAKFLVEASTVAIDNASIADLSEPVSDDDPDLLEEVVDEVVEEDPDFSVDVTDTPEDTPDDAPAKKSRKK